MKEIHEECGVLGVYSPLSFDISSMVYYGLFSLQHRGQESSGIVVCSDGEFTSIKDLGLVNDVFTPSKMQSFPKGVMAIGHVRYGTTGRTVRENCQPIEVDHKQGKLALAHNGNLSNAAELRKELELTGAIFHTTSDTEIIAYVVTRERLKNTSIVTALSNALDILEGAYSLVVMTSRELVAVRDPHGFRPLCYGVTKEGRYVIASESCALEAADAVFIRDIEPGEILVFNETGLVSNKEHCSTKPKRVCIFEYIYFARPDSVIDGVPVNVARMRAGEVLAKLAPVEADVVIGVPDSGLDAAIGYAEASGIPFEIGFVKNKYIGRTFIAPKKSDRSNKVKIKLNPIRETIEGKRVVLLDDSIVRGTTSRQIVGLLRECGAKEIHLRISAPPFLNPCYYGTDIDSRENLVACNRTTEEIAALIGVDSLQYLPVSYLSYLISSDGYCSACFDGKYPTAIPGENQKNSFET